MSRFYNVCERKKEGKSDCDEGWCKRKGDERAAGA